MKKSCKAIKSPFFLEGLLNTDAEEKGETSIPEKKVGAGF